MLRQYKATLSYVLFIIAVNTLFVYAPGVAAFGESFSPADVAIGGIYVLRDFAQREVKHYIFIAMLIGTAVSYLFASKEIALASVVAFSVGEVIDWAIYTYTKRPLSRRIIWSSIVSSPIDSALFLLVAHRFNWMDFSIMVLGKLTGVVLLWGIWKWRERRSKKRVSTELTLAC